MAKKPEQPPASKPDPKTTPAQRLRELSGSGALIAAFQAAISDPLLKAILSCFAPAVIEVCFYVVDSATGRIVKHLELQERNRIRAQRKSELEYRLAEAKARLDAALDDSDLSAEVKDKLREAYANTKKTLAEKALTEVFVEDNLSISSEVSRGSATG